MFAVVVLPESLQVDSRSPLFVAGRVWLEIAGRAFPEAGWNDAPLSVLGSIGTAIRGALDRGEGDVYFFEGPYFTKLLASNDGLFRVVGVCDRYPDPDGGGAIEAEVTVPVQELLDAYRDAVHRLIGWAQERGETEVFAVLAKMLEADGV
ncbi:hypothetical protein ACFW1A_04855 [Kitasatospora sp. NPDC058965]|uniref:hypothetical protein n=1 Tax=Kitasatospora sp. NPDC058965 TaxID=3346682 RepID=UPI0036B35AF8